MPQKFSTITEQDIWAQLESELGPHDPIRPPNSVTAQEFAERRNCTIYHANHVLADLVRQGKMGRVKFRSDSGRLMYAYTMIQES